MALREILCLDGIMPLTTQVSLIGLGPFHVKEIFSELIRP